MLSSTKRRMSVLERSIQIPITAEIFLARAEERARLTGASFEEAFRSLPEPLARDEGALARFYNEVRIARRSPPISPRSRRQRRQRKATAVEASTSFIRMTFCCTPTCRAGKMVRPKRSSTTPLGN